MNRKTKYFFLALFSSSILFSCSSDGDDMPINDDDPVEVSPVVFDINAVPYNSLSEYNFFTSPMNDLNPVYGVLPYRPASQLFTDYAEKKRFVWMPEGVSAIIQEQDKTINFPVGTVLIKNFYYENVQPGNTKKIIETRLMIRKSEGWIFANYIWNDAQTDAVYDLSGGFVPVEWIQNGETRSINYRIPNGNECFMCHYASDSGVPGTTEAPIGPKPQNLNFAIDFSDGNFNQLQKLKDFGYISNEIPSNISSIIDYTDTSKSLDMRARSYLEVNCAHCHRDGGYSEFYPVRLNYTAVPDYSALGFCLEPNININGMIDEGHADHIFYPGDHTKSVSFYRMNTLQDNIKMPMIGRSVIHTEGVDLINSWIDSFEEGCE